MQCFESRWIGLLVNGSIAVAIAIVPCAIAILLNKDFIYYIKRLFATFKERGNKKVVESISVGKNIDDGETNKEKSRINNL